MPAFWKGVRVLLPAPAAADAAAVVVLVSAAARVFIATDVLMVVSAVLDASGDPVVVVVVVFVVLVRMRVCVSTTNVEGRSISVVLDALDVLLAREVFGGAGNETGPPPRGGSTNVAVMTVWVGVIAPGWSEHI